MKGYLQNAETETKWTINIELYIQSKYPVKNKYEKQTFFLRNESWQSSSPADLECKFLHCIINQWAPPMKQEHCVYVNAKK